MSLYPYFYDIDCSSRNMERDFFSPDFYSPMNRICRNFCRPPYISPWESVFQPLEHLSGALNRLTFNDVGKVTADDEKFEVNVDVQHFAPEEIDVKVIDGQVIVEGKHEEKRDQHGYVSRQFVRKYSLPKGCLPDTVQSKLSSDGVLTVTAPKVLPLPSTGEKIVPIVHTGPIKKQISTSYEASSENGLESEKSTEPANVNNAK